MDDRKDCCKDPENLELTQVNTDLLVNVCKVCGCRHFELTVDPGKLGMVGAKL